MINERSDGNHDRSDGNYDRSDGGRERSDGNLDRGHDGPVARVAAERRIAVVLNPNARGVRRARDLPARLRAVLGDAGEVVVTRSPAELATVARRLAGDGIGLVAACGGDGTNLATLTALVDAYGRHALPTFAILRGGTVNTIAQNLGIGGRPETVLARLVAHVRARRPIPVIGHDVLCVDGRFGFLFAALMGARFLEAYYDGVNPGLAWAGLLAIRTVASSLVQGPFARRLFAPTELGLNVDGDEVPINACRLLLASTVRDVGIGMKVTWQAGRALQRFHLIASGLSTTSMALQLPRVLAGEALHGWPHVDRLAATARIRFATPQPYTLDGDLFRARELDIAIGPRVWIARP